MPKIIEGFKNFILRGNAVDLAVGVVIGASFNGLISSLVKDLITPLIGIFVKSSDFSKLAFSINGSQFLYGDAINMAISFFVVAAVIYFFVVIPMNALLARTTKPKPVTAKKCPECLSEIPIDAKRCAHCGQPQKI